ncbi:hypothetical protein D9619_004986 [Psilocybe cf. subviscida]|uniref:DUF6534 domain-containing protein n=1 Tax=Psilocybe cf. subviscida TaxID=2480587 RepID=A0A8H5F8D8_9AGAR|nr:hypothetical protein D9619_004986 [Psilocybe cf. subviscida]
MTLFFSNAKVSVSLFVGGEPLFHYSSKSLTEEPVRSRNSQEWVSVRILRCFTPATGLNPASRLAFSVRGFIDGSYAKLIQESWLLYTALGGSVVADVMITVSLCILLGNIRTGFKLTDSLVNTLMLYTINTGLLTSVSATACFVTFAIWPHAFVFIGFYFVLSKLYINSLLAMLNTRERLRKKNTGITSIPRSPSCLEPLPINTPFMTCAPSRTYREEFAIAKPLPVRPAWNNFQEIQTI